MYPEYVCSFGLKPAMQNSNSAHTCNVLPMHLSVFNLKTPQTKKKTYIVDRNWRLEWPTKTSCPAMPSGRNELMGQDETETNFKISSKLLRNGISLVLKTWNKKQFYLLVPISFCHLSKKLWYKHYRKGIQLSYLEVPKELDCSILIQSLFTVHITASRPKCLHRKQLFFCIPRYVQESEKGKTPTNFDVTGKNPNQYTLLGATLWRECHLKFMWSSCERHVKLYGCETSCETTGSPSSKYEHRRTSALLRNILNIMERAEERWELGTW